MSGVQQLNPQKEDLVDKKKDVKIKPLGNRIIKPLVLVMRGKGDILGKG